MAKQTRRTQAERSRHSTEMLLEATTQLIAEQGFSNTTVPQIAERAGFSHGLVIQRFGSKAELVQVLVKRFHDYFRHERLIPALKRSGGKDELLITLDMNIDSIVSSGSLGRAYYQLYGESVLLGPEVHGTFVKADRDFRKVIEVLIRHAVERGELEQSTNTKTLALLLLSIIRGFAMQWTHDEASVDHQAIKTEIHFLIEQAYAAKA